MSVEEDRYAIDGWSGWDEGVGIETVVADDRIVPDNLGPKHPFEFLTGVGTVSAGGNQDGYPVLGHVAKFAEQDWEDGGSGHGPGHVADGDCYGLGLVD